MKVVFDTNVYIAESLGGDTARRILLSTERASWRTYVSQYIIDEMMSVMTEDLGLPRRSAMLAAVRTLRRGRLVKPIVSRHEFPGDAADSEVLRTALRAGAHYLVTNDRHLLALHPYEGMQIITMARIVRCWRTRCYSCEGLQAAPPKSRATEARLRATRRGGLPFPPVRP